MDREKIISEFERWCDEMDDECPVICLDALALLKEQEEQIKRLEHDLAVAQNNLYYYVNGND